MWQSLAMSTGEKGEVAAVNQGGQGWHSEERWDGGSESWWAGNPSEARRWKLLKTLSHNRE